MVAKNAAPKTASPLSDFFEQQSQWWSQWSQLQFDAMHPNFQKMPLPEWLQGLVDEDQLKSIQQTYVDRMTRLYNSLGDDKMEQLTPIPDRRFSGHEWHDHGIYQFLADAYLINSEAMLHLAEAVQTDEKTKRRLHFAVTQWVDAMSPANYLATNPEAQKKIMDSGGESLKQGMLNLLEDVQKGRISMTDESKFEVGKNVATTEGAVVYENDYFQLIQYKPLTVTVGIRPLLIVPPCINKFYILDLQPENSLVRYAVEQGNTVFLMSWRNPDESCMSWTWDDYIQQAVIEAIRVSGEIARTAFNADKINALGFCVGGTLLTTALAVLAAQGQKPVASLTLLTTLLDFTDTGILDVFIDEAQVRMREETIGRGGLMSGRDLAATFSSLRPNDLVWPYVVGNYLKGENPPPFDLLYWNADSTHLPGPMYAWYLRNTYLENNLVKPGKTRVAGTGVDLAQIQVPVYIYGSRDDHIVPWQSAYASTQVLKGMDATRSCFVLGASGHIAGVINPASKNKRNYWAWKLTDKPTVKKAAAKSAASRAARAGGKTQVAVFPAQAEQWLQQAESVPGSWWPHWNQWLQQFQGLQVKAPAKYGAGKYKALESAPGRYVKLRVA